MQFEIMSQFFNAHRYLMNVSDISPVLTCMIFAALFLLFLIYRFYIFLRCVCVRAKLVSDSHVVNR